LLFRRRVLISGGLLSAMTGCSRPKPGCRNRQKTTKNGGSRAKDYSVSASRSPHDRSTTLSMAHGRRPAALPASDTMSRTTKHCRNGADHQRLRFEIKMNLIHSKQLSTTEVAGTGPLTAMRGQVRFLP